MRVLLLISCLILICATQAASEARNWAEAFGGYSLLNGDLFHGGSGWEFSLTKNLMVDRGKPWLGIQGDFGAHHQSNGLAQRNEHSFLFGPQFEHSFERMTITGRVLAGLSRTSGLLQQNNSFSYSVGGGADWNLTDFLALRVAQFDYQPIRLEANYQHNARISVGIVFRIAPYYDRTPRHSAKPTSK
jgi:hypothetical protein